MISKVLFALVAIISTFGMVSAVPLENTKHLKGETLNPFAVEHMEMAAASNKAQILQKLKGHHKG